MMQWIRFCIWVICFQVIGGVMGRLTESNIPTWYAYLDKSSLTPPGYVFGIVWTILYILLAAIAWLLWEKRQDRFYKNTFSVFMIQMLMNWAWTPLFFQYRLIGIAFIWLITMTLITGYLIISCRKQARTISLLLFPYFLWLSFATYLNGMIWALNVQ